MVTLIIIIYYRFTYIPASLMILSSTYNYGIE